MEIIGIILFFVGVFGLAAIEFWMMEKGIWPFNY